MRILLSESQIATRLDELGRELSVAYRGRPLTVVGVLTGSLLFVADLMRKLDVPHQVGFLQASSYRTGTKAGTLSVNREYFPEIADRDVLLIDDIFDTGCTLSTLLEMLHTARPSSLRTAVLLWKEGTQKVALQPDFFGFKIPNEFVVGYGLDHNQNYRHLPHIAVLEASDLA
ncbi:MAG: hypoxanthine phosphoribosyltransferase [Planctomycetaceae bacterium]|nr:hypoxanthine phosphoribosyltransferase [Planctomycetaceae bacterium]